MTKQGILKRKGSEWYVTHIMNDNGVQFGVDYLLDPTLEKYYFLDEDAEGGEVQFDIIDEFTHPELYQGVGWGDGIKYARLVKPTKTPKIYESPDKGETVYERKAGDYTNKELVKEQTNGERFDEFMRIVENYPELESTNALCDDIIKKRTGKMTEEEWQAAENNLKPKYTPGKGISFYIAKEISDEEIEKAAKEWYDKKGIVNYKAEIRAWVHACKWYREQLRKK